MRDSIAVATAFLRYFDEDALHPARVYDAAARSTSEWLAGKKIGYRVERVRNGKGAALGSLPMIVIPNPTPKDDDPRVWMRSTMDWFRGLSLSPKTAFKAVYWWSSMCSHSEAVEFGKHHIQLRFDGLAPPDSTGVWLGEPVLRYKPWLIR